MVFQKAKSRATSSTGRPTKNPEETFEAKPLEEKRRYWREKKQVETSQGEVNIPGRQTKNSTTSTNSKRKDERREYLKFAQQKHRSQSSDANTSYRSRSTSPKQRGRPTLGETPMTPRSLSTRKRCLSRAAYDKVKSERQREKTSHQRSKSAASRWSLKVRLYEGESIQNSDTSEEEFLSDVSVVSSSSTESDDDDDDDTGASETRKLAYNKLKLKQLLPSCPLENMDLFIHYVKSHESKLNFDVTNYNKLGNHNERKMKSRGMPIVRLFSKCNMSIGDSLLTYWIEMLMKHKFLKAVFQENEWTVPEKFLTTELHVEMTAKSLEGKYLKRNNTTDEQRRLGALYVIDVAKSCGLSSSLRGSTSFLARYTACSWRFAQSVLAAIDEGTENELLTRDLRCDAIHADRHWTDKITSFVLSPENARACPGQEKVSIKYGVRRPKFVLRKSRAIIAEEFLNLNPQCKYKASTIIREFPQNAVTPTVRDCQRNSCPYHCNARRMINALHKVDIGKNITSSCREIICQAMCKSDAVTSSEPTQWNRNCVYGICQQCPTLDIVVPEERKGELIIYSQWKYGIDEVKKVRQLKKNPKKKNPVKVFGLFNVTETIEDAIDNFLKSIPKLKDHIFTAYSQWNGHAINRQYLCNNSVITIEDYQLNLEIVHSENPTSMAYSSNKTTVALFPICVEFANNGNIEKGAVVFLSDDKNHDCQQVTAFEQRLFEILRDKIPHPILHWQRWSDGCGEQFRSQFCNTELNKANERFGLKSTTWEYFEAHEGKNISDTIGSIIKCAYLRAMTDHHDGVHSAADVSLLSILPESTKKFSFFVIESFPEIERVPAGDRTGIPVKDILKMHSIRSIKDGILARKITCTDCTISELCEPCSKLPPTKSIRDDLQELPEQGESICDEDIHLSDSDSDSEETYGDAEFRNGDVVWAKYGKVWYPAKICGSNEIPKTLKNKLQQSTTLVPVLWYIENKHSLVQIQNIDQLSQNRVDEARASVSEDILLKYNEALSDLRND